MSQDQPQQIQLPAPSLIPVVMALAIAVALIGLISTWVLTAVGGALFVITLLRWISAMHS